MRLQSKFLSLILFAIIAPKLVAQLPVSSRLTPNSAAGTMDVKCDTIMDSNSRALYPGVSSVCAVSSQHLNEVCPGSPTAADNEKSPESPCEWQVPLYPGDYYQIKSQHYIFFEYGYNVSQGGAGFLDPLGFEENNTFSCDSACSIGYSGVDDGSYTTSSWELATTQAELQTVSISPVGMTVYNGQTVTLETNIGNADARFWCLTLGPSGCQDGAGGVWER